MKYLKEYINLDKRGGLYYEIPDELSSKEKTELLNEFTTLHADNKSWNINMHMTKRSMPFVIYGKISFRSRKGYINKLIIYFDKSSIINNTSDQKLVWDCMDNVKFWKGVYPTKN